MQSPLIIAMPEPMAVTLQKSIGAVGWKEILEITRDPAGWKSYGRAEWGAFQLGGTKPTSSTSGLHALIAIYSAAADMRELESSDVRRDDVRRLVCGVYSRLVHETDSVGDFLTSLLGADQRGDVLAYASAIAIEEKQVFEYNRGNPRSDYPAPPRKEPSVKLMALYPREGTLVADHPYVVLNASWVSDAAKAAASDFLRYLWTDPVQTHFRGAGFRDHEGQAGPEIAPPYFRKELVLERHAPEPAVLAELLRSWGGLRTCPVP
jgi:Ca-activated chloride channel family protein